MQNSSLDGDAEMPCFRYYNLEIQRDELLADSVVMVGQLEKLVARPDQMIAQRKVMK